MTQIREACVWVPAGLVVGLTVALAAGRKPEFTIGGPLAVLVAFAILGTPLGLIYV